MERSGNFYKAIQLGYILISILIGCMAYNSLYEWQEIEALELGNKKIDELRKEINNINIQMIKFSLLGDLEIDTIIGKNHKGAILTINDRATSRVWIRKLSGKEAIPVAKITVWALRKVKNLIHTITADNGKEFAKHEDISQKLDINFYFCKPYHSWERGANENTNGLIRQYIPKGTDFSEVTNKRIKWIENNLNNRPRKRLGYLTPNEKFKQIINMNSVAFVT